MAFFLKILLKYSLERLVKLKLHQYFSHLMQKADSLGKTMILGKIEDRMKGMTENEMFGWHH